MSTFIRDWEELSKIPNESETHILEVDLKWGNAWLTCKNPEKYNDRIPYEKQIKAMDHYLSTHTFYAQNYKESTKLLQECGFDVTLDNWG